MSDLITQSVKIAAEAHEGQVDLAGEPYILHCIWVMNRVAEKTSYWNDEQRKLAICIAVLHDVVDDNIGSVDRLKIMSSDILRGLYVLTRQEKESYKDYISQVCRTKISRVVKEADLEHNLDLSRIKRKIGPKDIERYNKYSLALQKIREIK